MAKNLKLKPSELEVLILTPTGQDARLIAGTLSSEQISSRICQDAQQLFTQLPQSPGLALIAEEALSLTIIDQLNEILGRQEAWSDLPIIVLTAAGRASHASLQILKAFAVSGNVSFLERPLRPITLISSVQTALRARRRQYQVRELLQLQMQATRVRDEFISIASHELKTPLTSLKLQTQMSERLILKDDRGGLSPEKVKKLVDATHKQVDRLTRLVEDMLDISRINTGKLSIQKSEFDLVDLVHEVVERFLPQLEAVRSELKIQTPVPAKGYWDRYRIEQVISNLMTNAIRYAPGKPILVELTLKSGNLPVAVLKVQDEGIGISPENHNRVFERFERAVSSGNISGLGLGLYICKEIVQSHQGTIRVESELGRGSSFIVELPVLRS